jgi:hypothetical protein
MTLSQNLSPESTPPLFCPTLLPYQFKRIQKQFQYSKQISIEMKNTKRECILKGES